MAIIRTFLLLCLVLFLMETTLGNEVLMCKQVPSPSPEIPGVVWPPLGMVGPKGEPGIPGPAGEDGPQGVNGAPGLDCGRIEGCSNGKREAASSCRAIKNQNDTASNGLYDIEDDKGSFYRTYCDMSTGGGGWTLVASVHENFIQGKCTTGDRWSSEQGNNPLHPHGDGAWENTVMFGAPESAASDDYKNQGYFNMEARDVMIWHVPNNTPLEQYKNNAFMMYHTESEFLGNYGGNLYSLFKNSFPLRNALFQRPHGNGPSPAIVWDKGSNQMMFDNTPPNTRGKLDIGYIQFRGINNERGAFAICPGVKFRPNFGDVEHVCIGGTSFHGESPRHCGDFASKDWDGYASGLGWSSNAAMTESVVMIFYR